MRQQRLHRVHGADDVGARLPVEDDQHRRLAVGEAGVAQVFHPVGDLADIGKMHRRAVAVGHNQGLVVNGLVGLVVGINLVALVADIDAAFRAVRIGAGQRRPHVLEADAVFVDRLRNEIDPHRRQRTAADDDFADALDLRQLLRQHGRCGVIQIAARHRVRCQGQDDDWRIGRIDLAVGRIGSQAGRQVGAGRIDRGLYVARRAVDIPVQPELQGDARRSHGRGGGHLGHVGDLPEMTLERACDGGGDVLRAGAGQGSPYRDGRKIHLRQRRHRQLEKRHGACGCKPERQQRRGDRSADEGS